ncbi:MAG: 2OG-Fe(II) oxygenase [Bacillota bacterium]
MADVVFGRILPQDSQRAGWAYAFGASTPEALPEGNNWVAASAIVPRLFSEAECRRIVEYGAGLELRAGTMVRPGLMARRCGTAWIAHGRDSDWIYERIVGAVREANRKYGFDIVGMMDPLQFLRYEGETRDEIAWHMDCGEGANTTRKLSVTVQLSDPADYDGGDLEFMGLPSSSFTRHRGAAVLFPSLLAHRIAPVTRGVRHSLVAFFNGPPFR